MPVDGVVGQSQILFETGRYETYSERTRLETSNRPLKNIYLVREGCLAMVVNLPCGRAHCPEIYTPGDIAPVVGLLSRDVGIELVAVAAVTVSAIPQSKASDLVQKGELGKDWLFGLLENNVYWSEVRSIVTNFGDAAEKLAAVLAELWLRIKGAGHAVVPGAIFPLPLRQSYLCLLSGLSKAQVSRVFGAWTGSDFIRLTGDTLTVLNPEFLTRAIAGLRGLVPCRR